MASIQSDQQSVSGTSEGSTATHTSVSSSNPDVARVFVQLNNGRTIIVPVPQDSTIDGLHAQALRRAARLGVHGTIQNTLLQTTGTNPVVVFGEDSLRDVLDLTNESTFSLGSLDGSTSPINNVPESSGSRMSPLNLGSTPSHEQVTLRDSNIYIRWITLKAALENSRLRNISIDEVPIPSDTTLSDFHRIAVERLCSNNPRGSCLLPQKVNLFLRECNLHAENNSATLNDLGLIGGKHDPLDIFVQFHSLDPFNSLSELSLRADPKQLWKFDSTTRGMSTFITCLQMVLKEIDRGRCTLDGILEVLLELTHFPPLLLAFRSIHETGLDTNTPLAPVLLVASAVYALCRAMVPPKICQSSDAYLEASRQVIFWIYSLRSEASLSEGSRRSLVHRAQIRPLNDGVEYLPPFMPFVKVGPSSGSKRYLVSMEIGDRELCEKLGIAFHDKSTLPWNFYFQPVDDWKTLWYHKLAPMLHPNEFDSLIEVTNSMDAFRMVGPLQIGACLAAELPVITLSSKGYVSRYDHEDMECSERVFVTWNLPEGREKLPDNPGQYLSQKLDPILVERKKTDNWKLDAWHEWTNNADFGVPDEAVVICVDTSSSMDEAMPMGWITGGNSPGLSPSRLHEVKEFFKNLSLRISALHLSTHLGLVTFSNNYSVIVKQPLTPLHINFSDQLDNIRASGATAIFDAIDKASQMLIAVKRQHPKTKCRIILLTDGEDNKSTMQPGVVSSTLFANNIVLDAVVIGSTQTSDLFKMAKNTGGYAFAPRTQQSHFQIFLLETVVDIRTRPNITKVPVANWAAFQPKPADMANPYDFPPCRPHPNVDDYFIALADAERFMNRMSRRSAPSSVSTRSTSTRLSAASTVTAGAGGLSRILLSEIKAMIDNPHDYIDIYVSQSNMGFWKVVMQGPPDSPYATGTFLLYIEMGSEFPRKPPSARFITPMLHPNITKHGRICHPIFDREWSPATHVYQVLQQLYGILMSLEARDAIDPLSALRFWTNEEEGNREVENYVTRFARRSRDLHRLDIIGDDVSSVTSSTAQSTTSNLTITPQPSIFAEPRNPTAGLNPFSNPPSYRSSSSVSGVSTRSTSTTSTLFNHLANQRRPSQAQNQPPPLMATSGDTSSRVGSDGRNRLSKRSGPSGGASDAAAGSRRGSETEAGPEGSGRRLSRRASFFSLLRNSGNSGN